MFLDNEEYFNPTYTTSFATCIIFPKKGSRQELLNKKDDKVARKLEKQGLKVHYDGMIYLRSSEFLPKNFNNFYLKHWLIKLISLVAQAVNQTEYFEITLTIPGQLPE